MTEQYEITFILDEGSKTDKVENILRAEGAELKATQDLGVKQFVYPIKKKTSGNYFAIEFTAPKEKLSEIETELKAEKNLIRYLIVKEIRKPIDLPPRIKPEGAEEHYDKKEKVVISQEVEPEIKKTDKVEEITAAPEVESNSAEASLDKSNTAEASLDEEEVVEVVESSPEVKVEKPEEVKIEEVAEKPKRKPRAKAEKVSAEELDKKLEELVKE